MLRNKSLVKAPGKDLVPYTSLDVNRRKWILPLLITLFLLGGGGLGYYLTTATPEVELSYGKELPCEALLDRSKWSEDSDTIIFNPNTGRSTSSDAMLCVLRQWTEQEVSRLVEEKGHMEVTIHSPTGEKWEVSTEACLEELPKSFPLGLTARTCLSAVKSWRSGYRESNFHPVRGIPEIMRSDIIRAMEGAVKIVERS